MRSLFLLCLVLVLAVPASGQYTCSNATLTGYYGFASNGIVLVPGADDTWSPVPSAVLGTVTLNGDGTGGGNWVAMHGTQFMEGGVADLAYSVKSDCSGEMKYKLTGKDGSVVPGELIETFVIHQNGEHIRSMMTQGAMGKPVNAGEWMRISEKTDGSYSCSAFHVAGRYSYLNTGISLFPKPDKTYSSMPVNVLSTATADTEGVVSGKFTWLLGPQVIAGTVKDASIVVNHDCTGSYRYRLELPAGLPDPGEMEERFIVLGGGNELRSIMVTGNSTSGSHVGVSIWERINQ